MRTQRSGLEPECTVELRMLERWCTHSHSVHSLTFTQRTYARDVRTHVTYVQCSQISRLALSCLC
jgi:hypothetical protein